MWKESLRIGVDTIDAQHKELFQKTEELLKEIQSSGVVNKDKCISTILFLKGYAVDHFADEEAYQQSINYKDCESHQKLHERFVKTVLQHERKMLDSDFAEKDVKEFTGMLVAWLLYHVAVIDQQIGREKEHFESLRGHAAMVCDTVSGVLSKVAGFDADSVKTIEALDEIPDDALIIEVAFDEDIDGSITFIYLPDFIHSLIYAMMSYVPSVIDELELSALFETSNIISGTICSQLAKEKGVKGNVKAPVIAKRAKDQPDERITIDTGVGVIEVDLFISYN